jgi:hypothetical protein
MLRIVTRRMKHGRGNRKYQHSFDCKTSSMETTFVSGRVILKWILGE